MLELYLLVYFITDITYIPTISCSLSNNDFIICRTCIKIHNQIQLNYYNKVIIYTVQIGVINFTFKRGEHIKITYKHE